MPPGVVEIDSDRFGHSAQGGQGYTPRQHWRWVVGQHAGDRDASRRGCAGQLRQPGSCRSSPSLAVTRAAVTARPADRMASSYRCSVSSRRRFEYLVKEDRGRRVTPVAPDQSLLLRKAAGAMAHGGGKRLTADSPSYALLRRWIEQGMPFGRPEDPSRRRHRGFAARTDLARQGEQQLLVLAHFSDGSLRDVDPDGRSSRPIRARWPRSPSPEWCPLKTCRARRP